MAIKKVKLPNNTTEDINDPRLPVVTTTDDGKVLSVSGGIWSANSKPSYTLDEVSDGSTRKLADYLPLTGGTISRNSAYPLAVEDSRSNSTFTAIAFGRGGNNLGFLGFDGQDSPVYLSYTAAHKYPLLHEGNFIAGTDYQTPIAANTYAPYNANGYLPLNGGTLTGNLTMGTNNIVFNNAVTNDWNSAQNSGLRMLNTLGTKTTGAYSTYCCGLSVNGYYGFQLTSRSNLNEFAMRATSGGASNYSDWVTLYHSGNSNKSDVAWTCNSINVGTSTSLGKATIVGTADPLEAVHIAGSKNIKAVIHSGESLPTRAFVVHATFNASNYPNNIYLKTRWNSSEETTILTVDQNGNFTASGTITPGSDSRIKDNQKSIKKERAFDIIERLDPKTWTWNNASNEALNGKTAAGLIAQEVKEVLPDAVSVSEMAGFKDFHSLNYNTIQGYEIAAIKGLIEEVKSLKAEIAELKKQIK